LKGLRFLFSLRLLLKFEQIERGKDAKEEGGLGEIDSELERVLLSAMASAESPVPKSIFRSIKRAVMKKLKRTSAPSSLATGTGVTTYQILKDLAREVVSIDGNELSGKAVRDLIGSLAVRIWEQVEIIRAQDGGFDLGEGEVVAVARDVLSSCCRTESGGDTYYCVETLLFPNSTSKDLAVVVPGASDSSPISVHVDIIESAPMNIDVIPPSATPPSPAKGDKVVVGEQEEEVVVEVAAEAEAEVEESIKIEKVEKVENEEVVVVVVEEQKEELKVEVGEEAAAPVSPAAKSKKLTSLAFAQSPPRSGSGGTSATASSTANRRCIRIRVQIESQYRLSDADPQDEASAHWIGMHTCCSHVFYVKSGCNGVVAASERVVSVEVGDP
jgi:hypothetical protein